LGDLVANAGHRELVEGLRVAVGVAADRHPGRHLAPDQVGVAQDLAANHEEGGRGLSLGEEGQDLLGAMRPGAIVEGERHRQRPCGVGRGVEGNRHYAA
jgi:hypothetical protein